jgi:hypothetical protein
MMFWLGGVFRFTGVAGRFALNKKVASTNYIRANLAPDEYQLRATT